MLKNIKCVEYYFDSNKYNKIDVMENMEKEKLEFPKKKAKIEIYLNEYGIYIGRLLFENNQLAILNKFKIDSKSNKEKVNKINDTKIKKYKTKNTVRKYGQYKETKAYKPI